MITASLGRRVALSGFLCAFVVVVSACSTASSEPPPVVTPPDFPNELPGMTRLTERGFVQAVEDGWGEAFSPGPPTFAAQADPTAPKSPPGVMVVTYRAGFEGGFEPINTFKTFAGSNETLYVSFWVKFSSNWVGHPSGVNKIFHIFIANINRVYLSAQGVGQGIPLQPQIRLQQVNYAGGFVNLTPNLVPSIALSPGTWHRWEFLLITNTCANTDGVATWWIDGVKVGHYANIGYVNATQSHSWGSINWAPTWGGIGTLVSTPQSMSLDHIYVSGR
jgi:hypothetical protein